MRRALTSVHVVTMAMLFAGCCTTTDALKAAAKGNTRDLRILRTQVVTQLPTDEIEVGGKMWTVRGIWDNRIASFIVKARSIEAGLAKDKSFDVKQASEEEGVTKTPR